MINSISQNDIEAKNNSMIQNSKISFDRWNYNYKNDIIPQKNNNEINAKPIRKIEQVKEKTKGISEILAKAAVIAVGAATGVIGTTAIMPPAVKAEIEYVEFSDTAVFYGITLEEMIEGAKIVLYNDFTNREQIIEEQSMQGVFENLKSNMKYTLAIKQGIKVLAQTTFTTAVHEEWQDEPDPYEEPIVEDIDDERREPILSDDVGPISSDDEGQYIIDKPTGEQGTIYG